MKQNLLNKLWLRVCMIVAVMTTALAGTAWAETKTFDFKFETIGTTGWASSYAAHSYAYTEGTVKFTAASKQGSTITDMPVTKGQPVEFVMADDYTMSAVTFTCKQWTTKAQTITLHYSTDGGTTYTSTDITSSNFTISSDNLPSGTNAVKITFSSTSNQIGVESATITYASSGGSGDTSVATTTTIDDSGITNTDVYAGTAAGSLAATVVDEGDNAVSGAIVTWSGNNDAVATIDASTGVVTLVAAGKVTFTASYAGVTGEYKASSDTYEMTVTDSTPFTGGDVTFVCGTDVSETTSITKDGVTMTMTGGVWNRTDNYRLYANQSITISTASGTITSIVFTISQNNFSGEGYDADTKTWTGNATSVTLAANGGQVRFTPVVVTVDAGGAPSPVISADDVNIAYDATNGTITYTLTNEVTGGSMSAASSESWLTVGTPTAGEVPFTCSANTGAARTATVTLTYAYGAESVTKNVTVTQEANPNILDNISDITAAGTYTVQGTIVAKSQRGFIVGDGTGYVYYYNSSYAQADYNVGDKVKLAGSVVVYGGVYEFNNSTTITAATESNYVAEEPVVLSGADMDTRVASTTPAQLSTYVQYEGTLTVDGTHYNVTSISGATTAKGSISYPIDTEFTSLNGKKVKVKGYYVGISSSQYYNTLIGSIEEIVTTEPSVEVSTTTIEAPAAGLDGTIDVTYNNLTDVLAKVQFVEADGTTPATYAWVFADIDSNNNIEYIIEENTSTDARTAYMKVYAVGNEGDAYSDLITITQAGVVVDYAVVSFVYDGGKSGLPTGFTQYGLGNDYAAKPKLKFDSTGDYLIVKIDKEAAMLFFDIKGNSFSGGTFTVQTSADGTTYTDLQAYTDLGDTQTESFTLSSDVRFIKWIYTNKSNGNVGLGNIKVVDWVETVTVGAAGYATYVTEHNSSFPAGVTAYIGAVNGQYLTLTEVASAPKGTPVVLKGDEGTYTLIPTFADELADVSANELKASDTDVVADGTQYVLAKPAGKEVGFYLAATGSTIAAGKAYLEIASSVKAFTFIFGDDDPTSINEELGMKSEESSVEIFNIAGQRIQKIQKGINIVNGKKILR